MLSNKSVAPLRLELLPSRYHRYYLILVHGVGLLAAMMPTQLPWPVQLIELALVFVSAGWFWRRETEAAKLSYPFYWQWSAAQLWHDISSGKDWRMQSSFYLTQWLIIIPLQNTRGEQYRLRIWRDQLSDQSYRILYCRLKFWRHQPGATDWPQ